MSSVAGALSQVAPFKRYIAGSGANIFNLSTVNATSTMYTSSYSVAANTVLADMGKTSYAGKDWYGNVVVARKVQVLPTASQQNATFSTGYIWISDVVPNGTTPSWIKAQNITALN